MGDKKHIDRLFQERFKDFEVQPDDAVWDNIEAKLNEKKKKRRVIPIWWRYAGVAALLLLTFTIGSYIFNGNVSEDITPQVVDTEETDVKNTTDENLQKKSQDIINTDNTSMISNVDESKDKTVLPLDTSKETFKNTSKSEQQETVIAKSKDNSSVKTASEASKIKSKALFKNDASNLVADNTISKSKTEVKDNSTLNKNSSNVIIDQGNPKQKATTIASDNAKIETNTSLNTGAIETKEVAENNTKKEDQSIEEAIEKNKSLLEEEKTEVADLNKWSIAPNAAPVYFSSLGKGSSIDAQFNENSKSGEVNMSYGLNASYAINKRLTIRSGVNRVNLGYNTNDVVVFNSVSANAASTKTLHTLSNTVADNTAASSSISAGENVSIMSATSFKSSNIAAFETTNTSINQSFGFIEVPLELQYAVSTKRLGVNVIGGFSSLFLNNYESISIIEGQPTRLQENDNINNTSYSANFGLGLNYKVSEKINLNLEPMFKYQINTFKNTSGDFQPFFIGVYTGFGIKF